MRAIRLLALLTLLLFAAMAALTSPLQPSVPELQLTFTAAGFQEVIKHWSSDDLVRFRNHFLIDYPFLICYGWLGYLVATRSAVFAGLSAKAQRNLAWVLPVAALADALENLLHLVFISRTEAFPAFLYFLAGLTASGKWLLIVSFVGALIFAYRPRSG